MCSANLYILYDIYCTCNNLPHSFFLTSYLFINRIKHGALLGILANNTCLQTPAL
uniref:Uncharacterized protein n=1 Tax=Anguilla anguilla TaxID=7936 RepID=A0A0E9UD78_ANGAN